MPFRPWKIALLSLLCLAALQGRAEDFFVGLTNANNLIRFSSETPGTLDATVPITGLTAGETILAIDFRPATGQLYGLSSLSRLYVINPVTGAATAPGAALAPALTGTRIGFDFNPTADRIRVVTETNENIRLNPNTGGLAGTDTAPAYAAGDPNFGAVARLVGSAYTNNFATTSATTLYGIDSGLDVLATQGSFNGTVSPNGGLLFTVGRLGVDTSDLAGFDISSATGVAYAALTLTGEAPSKLFTINLFTGTAQLVGAIGSQEQLLGVSIVPPPTTFDVVALQNNNQLTRFDHRTPSLVTNAVPITGLQAGENILGIDFRPLDGRLYGLGSSNRLYTINPISGAATAVGAATFAVPLSGADFGFDFNPTVDRIRVVSNNGQNMRLNPDTGDVVGGVADTNLAFAAGDPNEIDPATMLPRNPRVVASAYTNNVAGATSTTLFGLEANLNILVIQNPPNAGTINSAASVLLPNFGGNAGFDIAPNGTAFASLGNDFFTINLTTGAGTRVGTTAIGGTGGGTNIVDIAVQPAVTVSTLAFSAARFYVIEKDMAPVTITRTGSTTGTVSVDIATSDGTALAGMDYTSVVQTVTFIDGESTKTVLVPALDDETQELFETVNLTLSNPIGAVIGAQATAVLDIADKRDFDGDGFTNFEENTANSSPTDASSTPFGGGPAGPATPLLITKFGAKLNFAKTASDTISFSGTLPVPTPFDFTGKVVLVNVGGIAKTFTLDAKGKSPKANDTISIGTKPKAGLSKYSVKFNKGDFASTTDLDRSLIDEGVGLTFTVKDKPIVVRVTMYFNNTKFQVEQNLLFSGTPGKSGSAKLPKK